MKEIHDDLKEAQLQKEYKEIYPYFSGSFEDFKRIRNRDEMILAIIKIILFGTFVSIITLILCHFSN